MSLLSAEQLTKRFDVRTIFDSISFTLKDGDRIGLVGRNGSGKTTLFELITGRMAPDNGAVSKSKGCLIDYIEQEQDEYLEMTLFEFVASARADLLVARKKIDDLENELQFNPDDKKAIEKLGKLHEEFEHAGGFNFENELNLILFGLGFEKYRHDDLLRNFSGGEKNRAALSKALAGRGTLLLLDEPTNHLDIESTKWLEEYLKSSGRAYIVVSHDRAFLNQVVTQVWEINSGKIDLYHGNFDRYLAERAERRRLHAHHYRHQQEEIKRLEYFVQKHMAGQKTKQAQSKLKYLNRIKRLPPPRADQSGPNIKVSSSGRSYQHVLAVENAAVGYGSMTVVDNVAFDLYRGDKVGLIGRNGSGKTTLLRTLIGELAPISGDIRLGNNVDVAYFDQELSELNPSSNVIDTIWELDPTAEAGKIRSFLARFGFSGEDVLKVVSALSGGEKTKLSLARLLYHPANFVIFDEPTNHLDVDSREALEQALLEYDGSCLIVSHDRYFLNSVVNRIVHIEDGQARNYDGNYAYFEEMQERLAPPPVIKEKKSKQSFLEFKEASKRKARHKKEIVSTRSKIADFEKELSQLEKAIQSGIPKSDWEKLQEATENKKSVEEKLLELYAHLEKLEKTEID